MKPIRSILILFLFLFWAGCGSPSQTADPAPPSPATPASTGGGATNIPPNPSPTVAAMTLVPSEIKLPVGGTQTFSVEAEDASGNVIKNVDIAWIVSDTAIASVTAAGEVTALTVGTTVLTARHADLNKTATIEVTPPPVVPPKIASIEIAPNSLGHLKIGAKQQFQATAKDSSNVKIEGATFSWSSSESSIVVVDGTGLATALQPGQAAITASADNITSAPVSLIVDPPPPPPTARISASTRQGSIPLSVRFDGTASSDPDGAGLAYEWDFGDGTAAGAAAIVDHLYQTVGSYVVTLKVTDHSGRSGTATTTINATSPVPPGDCTPAATTGWERVNSPAIGDMWGIHFINPCEGWSVGMEMALAHTTDGGKSWTKQDNIHWNGPVPEVPPDIYDVFFLDKNTGWAAGWPELILFTTDGGATWNEQRLNRAYTTQANYCGIWADSAHTVCTKKNGVYLRRVRFADPQNGWTIGRFGYIFKTNNGGTTWQDNVVVPNPVYCAANPAREIGGKYTPHWFGLDVQSAAEIWIAGGSDDGAWCTGWNRVIIHTVDGGATWLYRNDHPDFGALPGSGRFQDLHLIGDNGWAVGEIGTILRTLDHGATWSRVTGTGAGGATLWGLSFTDPMNVWITGTNGALVHSPDGGASWCKQESGTGTQLRRSSFLDPNFGWIAGQDKIFRTTAGGKPQPTCASP